MSRVTVEDKGNVSYQSVDVIKYDLAVAFLKSNSTDNIVTCLRDCIKAHHMQLLTDIQY